MSKGIRNGTTIHRQGGSRLSATSQRPSVLISKLLQNFASKKPLRTGSLIVTVFGDSIAPRGNVVWLGSLIEALEPLGISHRLVRTAVYRLVQDNILANEQEGRRSYYTLTANGRSQFDEATQRIYADQHEEWEDNWCLVLTGLLDAMVKQKVRKDLSWLGFGQFGADVLAHPKPDKPRLLRHLEGLGCREQCVILDAQQPLDQVSLGLDLMVTQAWDLAHLEKAYGDYISQFKPIHEALKKNPKLSPTDAFYIRTFLIHEYRKVLLRDPGLPGQLLPAGWKGQIAYQLTKDVYRRVVDAAETFADMHFENQVGALPPPQKSFYGRFSDN